MKAGRPTTRRTKSQGRPPTDEHGRAGIRTPGVRPDRGGEPPCVMLGRCAASRPASGGNRQRQATLDAMLGLPNASFRVWRSLPPARGMRICCCLRIISMRRMSGLGPQTRRIAFGNPPCLCRNDRVAATGCAHGSWTPACPARPPAATEITIAERNGKGRKGAGGDDACRCRFPRFLSFLWLRSLGSEAEHPAME